MYPVIPTDDLSESTAFHSGGTTAIDGRLLESLGQRSTHSPIDLPVFGADKGELTLFPQIPRYSSGNPDLGFYYDAVDVTVANYYIDGTLNILPGTVLATRQDLVDLGDENPSITTGGLVANPGATITARGSPARPIVLTDLRTVQEAAFASNPTISIALDYYPRFSFFGYTFNQENLPPPVIDLRFCNAYTLKDCYHVWGGLGESPPSPFDPVACCFCSSVDFSARDCLFSGGRFEAGPPDPGNFIDPSTTVYDPGSISFTNNLFNHTVVVIAPSFYDLDPAFFDIDWDIYAYFLGGLINCDVSFSAFNNHFVKGKLSIWPHPAAAGNWTLKDNLFDKVVFRHDFDEPIDHDFNAYWPRTASELVGWELPRLWPEPGDGGVDAVHDVTLNVPPQYQAGAYGRYYLSAASELYSLGNRGSRSVADAGLYHYTTRADQTKDGEQSGNVIIGKHYVATMDQSACPAAFSLTVTHDCFHPYYCGNLAYYVYDSSWQTVANGMLGPGDSSSPATLSAAPGQTFHFMGQNNSYDYSLDFSPTLQSGGIGAASDGTAAYGESGDPLCPATPSDIAKTPKDLDSDGIPDFVENWHGDAVHWDTESDWQNDYSTVGADGTTHVQDKFSLLYDDLDIDGDGMAGRVEKALAKDPLLSDNPFDTALIPTGKEPDVLAFAMPMSYNSITNLGAVELDVDGSRARTSGFLRTPSGGAVVRWNTTYERSGPHLLNLRFRLAGAVDPMVARKPAFAAPGPLSFSPVSNVLSFDSFFSTFREGGDLHAELGVATADYAIKLKDPSGVNFRTFSGTTSEGMISVAWDGKDSNGQPYSEAAAIAEFEIWPGGAASGSPSETHYQNLLGRESLERVPDGRFTVAFTGDNLEDAYAGKMVIQADVVDPLLDPYAVANGPLQGPAYFSAFNQASFGGLGGKPGYLPDCAAVAELLSDLGHLSVGDDTRNFCFSGHGTPDLLTSYDLTTSIHRDDVALSLGNNYDEPTDTTLKSHPYRLVLLFACATASDNGWADAFGVVDTWQYNYLDHPDGVQALVGYVGEGTGPHPGESVPSYEVLGVWMDWAGTFAYFFDGWMNQVPLNTLVEHCQMRWPPDSPFPFYRFFGPSSMDKSAKLKIRGFPGLKRTSYTIIY